MAKRMNRVSGAMGILGLVGGMYVGAGPARAADLFVKPTAEELAMKEIAGYPGASAVVLFREQITKDDLHVVQHYDRIKVLTEEGKKYANVELSFVSLSDFGEGAYTDDKSVGEISGRTIHADGTVIPFTGKPYKKTLEKGQGVKYQAMVFTLPDVEVGSILEYRYATRISDYSFESPDWYIQGDLYVKSAHFQWFPTSKPLVDSKERPINSISWFPILPPGAKIERHEIPTGGFENGKQNVYELTVADVAPQMEEEYMPPIASYSYRVLFSFTAYRSSDEFWSSEGKEWSKKSDSFTNPNSDLKRATAAVVGSAATPDEKLRAIYAAVMALENTDYTREHDTREDKAAGAGKLNSVADVLVRKRGNSRQMASLFVGMARAAGMKAYLMLVPDRSERLFTPAWLTFQQFDATIAIVNVNGKDVFFDPGSRYCPYRKLAWEHTLVNGLRQTDAGTDFALTATDGYSSNKTNRVADLKMDEQGEITGKIDLTFVGAPALQWRHRALRGDDESVRRALRTDLEEMLPKTLEVKVVSIHDMEEYDKPLSVSYEVKGRLGTPTGKRLVLPVDVFEVNSASAFPHEKRDLPVYFHYPQVKADAMRISFAKGMDVEAVPGSARFEMPSREVYTLSIATTTTSFTTQRNCSQTDILVTKDDYPTLRKFYGQFQAKDKETVVLKMAPAQTASVPSGN